MCGRFVSIIKENSKSDASDINSIFAAYVHSIHNDEENIVSNKSSGALLKSMNLIKI